MEQERRLSYMGITIDSLQLLLYGARSGIDFSRTLTIGRQSCYVGWQEINRILKVFDPCYAAEKVERLKDELMVSYSNGIGCFYAEPLFHYFGAEFVDSIDYSDYEGATLLHDMNKLIPHDWRNKFSCVVDGGALEHVFHFPVAIKNCMDMVELGGHIILFSPANNFFGHGFYQFSPELFYSLLSPENGYANTSIFMQDDSSNWFEVLSPKKIGARVDICCARHTPALMMVLSQRVGRVPNDLSVMQSDYIVTWERGISDKIPLPPMTRLSRILPSRVRECFFPFLRQILGINRRNYRSKIAGFYRRRKMFPLSDKNEPLH